jgi:hypothetical protein
MHRDATKTAASFSGALPGVYRGVIVSRDDPDKQGRVKVSLPHIYGDVPVDELPWVYPITSAWNTSDKTRPAGGAVNVPPMGAPVVCMFEGGDHRYPMYIGGSFGKPGFTDTVPEHSFAANGNSPDNYSFTSPRGTTIQCDERPGKEKVIMYSPEGNYVSMSKAGLIEVKSKDAVSIKGANLVSLQCDSAVQLKGNKVILYSTGDLVVEGANSVSLNSNSPVHLQGSAINLNCNTSQTGTPPIKEVNTAAVEDAK